MKKTIKIIGISLLAIITLLLIGLLVLALYSPGKLEPLKDKEGVEIVGSISEKIFTEIGGIKQGFFIRSENPENPVILFLHGGPGSPELPMFYPFETPERLEKYFTVCYWDQRGAGMSYSSTIDPTTMTLAQFIDDTRQITEYLQQRFNKQKIYLMGHSWGTYLGVKTIEKYPDNYIAFIGIGQISNQLESEKIAYNYMMQHAKEIGDKRAVKKLERFNPNASDFPSLKYLLSARSLLMNKYRIGIMHTEGFSVSGLIKNMLTFKGYTISEKLFYFKGSMFSLDNVWHYVESDNLNETSTKFQVPLYIIHGKFDYQVSHTLARQYFERIEAPDKAFFTFENSAHSPNVEEPDRFVTVVREITDR
jgi:pimeloyl-ACP methyl ester carboxylesterase